MHSGFRPLARGPAPRYTLAHVPLSVAQRLFQDDRVLALYERARESPLFWPVVGRTLGREVAEALAAVDEGADRGDEVLDVACGQGTFAVAVARARPALRVTGIDLSPQQIARARRKAEAAAASNVRFLEGDALAMPFEDATFRAVISFTGLHQIPDHERLAAEIARVSRPGASFFAATFARRGLPDLVRRGLRDRVGARLIDPQEWDRLLTEAGFRDLCYEQRTPVWGVIRARRAQR